MTTESIKLKTIHMIRTNNFNKIISSFSLEERLALASMLLDHDLDEYIGDYRDVLAMRLFTHEEAKANINKTDNPVTNTILFICLDDKSKIFYIESLYKWDYYNFFLDAFIESFEDYDCKKECLFYLIKTGKIVSNQLPYFLGELDDEERLEAFNLAYEHAQRSLDNNNIIDVLESFGDEKVRLEVLKKYLSVNKIVTVSYKNEYESNLKLIDESLFGEIVKCFGIRQVDAIDLMVDNLKERKKLMGDMDFDVEVLIDFVRCVKSGFKIYLLEKLLRNNILPRADIGLMTPHMGPDQIIPFLDLVINTIGDTAVSLELTFIQSISKLKDDVTRQAVIDFVINGKRLDVSKILTFASNDKLRVMIYEEIIKSKLYDHQGIMDLLYLTCFDNNYVEESDVILSYFASYYKVDKFRISKMIQKYGYSFLKYMNEKNIVKLLNLPATDIAKVLNLFDDEYTTLTQDDFNDVSNMLIQRQFKFEHKDVYQVFTVLSTLFKYEPEETIRSVDEILRKINLVIPLYAFCVGCGYKSIDDYVDKLYSQDPKAIEELHDLTNRYLEKLRERYQVKRQAEMENEIKVERVIERHLFKKNLCLAVSAPTLISYLRRINKGIFNEAELKLIADDNLINGIVELRSSGQISKSVEYEHSFKESLVLFDRMLNKIYDNAYEADKLISDVSSYMFIKKISNLYSNDAIYTIFRYDSAGTRGFKISKEDVFECLDNIRKGVKRSSYKAPLIINQIYRNLKEYNNSEFRRIMDEFQVKKPRKISGSYVLDVLSRIQMDSFKERVLDKPKEYERLQQELKKYHMIGWGTTFDESMKKADLVFNESTLASFFNYFKEIMDKTDHQGLSTMLDYCNCFDSASYKYKCLLGKENYELIANNAGDFKAPLEKRVRLEKTIELIKRMHERSSITIPHMRELIDLGFNKKIVCEISGTTNVDNLAMGERTNSCLRIGGNYNDLFEFCLLNEEGFHIVFREPGTNRFISRASGFRNGNTIFINELRNSVDLKKYHDSDLAYALNKFMGDLAKETEKSEMPISNVMCSIERVFKTMEHVQENSPFIVKPKDVYGLHFSPSFNNKVVTVYTTAKPGWKPIFKGYSDDKRVRYPLRRDESIVYMGEKALEVIKHMSVLNDVLEGKEFEEIELPHLDGVKYCVKGVDWIVIVYEDGRIENKILPSCKDRTAALEEINYVILKINDKRTGGVR